MVKKKYFLYLSMLLLMLFIGLSGTCYASNLTENNIRNFMYFIMVDGYKYDPTWTYNYLANIDFNNYPNTNTNLVSSFLANNTYNCNVFLQGDTIYITFLDKAGNNGKITQNDSYYYYIPTYRYIGVQIKTDSSTNKTGILSTIEHLNSTGNINSYAPARYFESDVYYYNNSSVLKQAAPINWCNANTFGQAVVRLYSPFIDYEDLAFDFSQHSQEISLLGVDNIPYINIKNNNYFLGTLLDHDNSLPRWFASDYLEIFYYDNNWNNSYKLMQRTFINEDGEFINNITDSNRYLDIIYDSSEREYKYYLKSPYIYYNMLYHYQLEYIENYNVVKYINVYWYNYNNRTIILNGTINDTTFDNYDTYLDQIKDLPIIQNNNENTDLIIANQKSGDQDIIGSLLDNSQVESMVLDYGSGDVNNLSSKLGYTQISNPYATFIYGLLEDICDVLKDTGDVTFNVRIHGNSPVVLHSKDIYMPDSLLKTFITSAMIFIVIWYYFNRFKDIVDGLSIADTKSMLESVDVDTNYFYM